jgi:hypothetical protein
MHAVVNTPLPPHDEKTNAAILYSEKTVYVISADKIKTHVRVAYKILRPSEDAGVAAVSSNGQQKVTELKGWCIPASGKDFEVTAKNSVEISLPKIDGSDLITDVKEKIIQIPAAEPGNILGYEYEVEEHPLFFQDVWDLQGEYPVAESRFTLILPPGWEWSSAFIHHPDVQPTYSNQNTLTWVEHNIKGIHEEKDMPPFRGVVGQMVVSFFPTGGRPLAAFANWKQMGDWYFKVTSGRRDPSDAIKQKVAELTASTPDTLGKMKAIANFLQHDIRYVSIQLGVGGFQPHPASEIFSHQYGDCKDKATLMSSMLHEIGVESYYVVINAERGSVTLQTPAYAGGFNHLILAVRLPENLRSPEITAVIEHPKLGRLLFFDPTSELTPFGKIGGYLQSNVGLLVTPDGGELTLLPQSPSAFNGVQRTGKFTLSESGALTGDVDEIRIGD